MFALLLGCGVAEALALAWLLSHGTDTFAGLVTHKDSASYLAVGRHLAETGTLVGGQRTPGYPFFLAITHSFGGGSRGLGVTVAVQLGLNLAWTALAWHTVGRIVPASTRGERAAAALVVSWAGLGMALLVLSDSLAALLFAVSIYGLFFWRSPGRLALACLCLGLATLTRPSFTLAPLAIPVLALLAARFSTRLRPAWWVAFAASSLVATSGSIAYQRAYNDYDGISDVVTLNYERTVYEVTLRKLERVGARPIGRAEFDVAFDEMLWRETGREASSLDKNEREVAARSVAVAAVADQPGVFARYFVDTFFKYLFVPVEKLPRMLYEARTIETVDELRSMRSNPNRELRIALFVLCVPLLLLAYLPPLHAGPSVGWYYAGVVALVLWVVGQPAILAPQQGERMRLPILPFLGPIAVLNARWLWARLHR